MSPRRPTGKPRSALPCSVPGCGRKQYARGLCQTHHRHILQGERPRPIRPYRARGPDTVKFAGLRVSPDCAARIKALADAKGLSLGAAITLILEGWTRRRPSRSKRTPTG